MADDHMSPERRKQVLRKLGDLKQAFAGTKHPGITDAFDVAEATLTRVVSEPGPQMTARDITLHMLRAVMQAGFLIMHKDEMHDALLACAQIGKINQDTLPEALKEAEGRNG